MSKYVRYLIVVIFGVVAFGWSHFDLSSVAESRFIGGYPGLKQIAVGMTPAEVIKLLGTPKRKVLNDKHLPNFLGQGPDSGKIAEAWIFEYLLWSGAIEIYFDASGRVIGRNWGYG